MKLHIPKILLLGAILFTPALVISQSCTSISDEAGIFHDSHEIDRGSASLIDQGADVHIISVNSLARYGSRLSDVEKAYEQACPNWLAPNGQRKANLFVIIVAPKERLKNAFFGEAYASMFQNEDTVNTIYSQAANPYFKNSQFSAGVSKALKDFGSKVAAFHDQQKHPIQSSVVYNQQPADLKGLWKVLGLLLVLAGLGGALWLIILARRRRDQIKTSQQEAVAYQQQAATAFRAADSNSAGYSELAARYSNMANSISCDPTEDGLSVGGYESLSGRWRDLATDISNLSRPVSSAHSSKRTKQSTISTPLATPENPVRQSSSPAPIPRVTPFSSTPPIVNTNTTVVVHDNSNDLITGMFIGETLSEHLEASIHQREESATSYSSRDEDRSSDSGSDSSWGSSSSSSSSSDSSWSSSDSGSSFDSGGSDSSW